jgi:two-component system nitrate/nitrite response regulator NarL
MMNAGLQTARRPDTPTPAQAPIRVLLADDHAITLWGLRQLIESAQPRMVISGTAGSCAELLAHPELDRTDVVLLDLGLRDQNALGCLPQLVAESGVRVVVLTGELNPGRHRDAVLGGARGVVLKSQPAEHVLDAIGRVHAGEVWLDGTLMSMLLGTLPGLAPAAPPPQPDMNQRRIDSLTAKEREVVQAMVKHRGAKSLVVADALGMSEHTLRNHLTVIYSKLNVQGKLNLYVYALEHGLAAGARPPLAGGDVVAVPGYTGPERRTASTAAIGIGSGPDSGLTSRN